MPERVTTDICVIGGGAGGLVVAAGAAQMGARVVLVEKGRMGGDCLNFGCVPSKSLIAAARVAETVRHGARFGILVGEPKIDFSVVRDHVQGVIAAIAPQDSVERFEALGVRVIRGGARFVGQREIEAAGQRVRARYFVVATGSLPAVPPVPGLDSVPYLTNETVFDLDRRPDHLAVLGAGPIGCELAQAFRRLGARVTVLERFRALPQGDPELAETVCRRLRAERIDLREGVAVREAAPHGDGIALAVEKDGAKERVVVSHLLVAAGRRANVEELDLEAAGIRYSRHGIEVDARLRTTNRRVFAIGDVAGGPQFTHVAGYHAGIVLRNVLFKLPARARTRAIPWVVYTDPELAHVGLTEDEARERLGGRITVLRWALADNDRAASERESEGLIKVVVDRRGRILGASIAGVAAGELILPWVLAIDRRLKIGAMARLVAPYPTLSEITKRVAASYYTPSLFGERTKRLVRFLVRL